MRKRLESRRGRSLRGSLLSDCAVSMLTEAAHEPRTGSAEVLTRPEGRSTFMETFPNVFGGQMRSAGAFVPGPRTNTRWLPDWAAQGS